MRCYALEVVTVVELVILVLSDNMMGQLCINLDIILCLSGFYQF